MDILMAIGISLVALRHSFSPYRRSWDVSKYYEYSMAADYVGNSISTISMPLFVFISGYIYHFLRSNYGKYSSYKILFNKKSRRLIVPYLVLAPIYIYFFLDYNSIGSYLAHLSTGSGHLWFLLMMCLMFLIHYKFENYLNNHIVVGIILGLFLYLFSTVFNYYNLQPLGRVSKFFIFFLLGNYTSRNSKSISNYLKGKVLYIFLIHLVLFSTYFFLIDSFENKYVLLAFKKSSLITSLLALALVYGFLNYVVNQFKNTLNKIRPATKLINHTSYYIYPIHQPILKVYFTFVLIQNLYPIVGVSIAFIGAMTISIILDNIIMNFKWGRVLIGAK
jgi:fucose 4-O-acetylase-like acetyltransferase